MRYVIEGIDGKTGSTTRVKVEAQSGDAAAKIAAKHGITAKRVRRSRRETGAAQPSRVRAQPLPRVEPSGEASSSHEPVRSAARRIESSRKQRPASEPVPPADAPLPSPPLMDPAAWKPRRFYKVEVVREGWLGTLLLGSSKIPTAKMDQVLNRYGAEGWELAFMVVEQRRMLLFWKREAIIMTFCRVY